MDKFAKNMKKLAFIVNNMIALYVVVFTIIFRYTSATYMFYVSLGALAYYLLANILIAKNKLSVYVASLYFVITMFMFAAAICVGLDAGFQMYCLSMIPLLFYFDYLGEKLNLSRIKSNPILFSILIAVTYFGCTSYVHVSGAIYEIPTNISVFLLASNSLWVLMLLVFYSSFMVKLIRNSEKKLLDQAIMDELTKLYNRHYMLEQLEKIDEGDIHKQWVAILDIDNFKKVNDVYGHNAGDAVLVEVANIIRRVCADCHFARWGGEEFLVSSTTDKNYVELMEMLRSEVCKDPFVFDGQEIMVSITVGVCKCTSGERVDKWIQSADSLLYEGKNTGKNKVVSR